MDTKESAEYVSDQSHGCTNRMLYLNGLIAELHSRLSALEKAARPLPQVEPGPACPPQPPPSGVTVEVEEGSTFTIDPEWQYAYVFRNGKTVLAGSKSHQWVPFSNTRRPTERDIPRSEALAQFRAWGHEVVEKPRADRRKDELRMAGDGMDTDVPPPTPEFFYGRTPERTLGGLQHWRVRWEWRNNQPVLTHIEGDSGVTIEQLRAVVADYDALRPESERPQTKCPTCGGNA